MVSPGTGRRVLVQFVDVVLMERAAFCKQTTPQLNSECYIHFLYLVHCSFYTLRTDNTKKGYALSSPEQRDILPTPERSLSPAACAIIRAIMHSTLLWASCNNEVSIIILTCLNLTSSSSTMHAPECSRRSHQPHSW